MNWLKGLKLCKNLLKNSVNKLNKWKKLMKI